MHGLASLCHEAGNGGNNGRRCPKHARTVFLPDLDSIIGRVALFLRQGLVFFNDLSDPLKLGANLRLGAGLLQSIPRGLRVGQYLL